MLGGLLLLVVTLGAFVALVQRAFDLIQIGGVLRAVMRRARAAIDDVHPVAVIDPGSRQLPSPDPAAAPIAHAGRSAVVAAVDRSATAPARAADGRTSSRWSRVSGSTSRRGRRRCWSTAVRHRRRSADARRVLVLARQRTIDQDPAFALRILVDIAIRALSPAVNDPTTAVQVLDRIEDLLVDLARRRPGPSLVLDEDDEPRGRVPAPTWTEYLELGLTEIRQYGDAVDADQPAAARGLRPAGGGGGRRRAGQRACSSNAGCWRSRRAPGSPTSTRGRLPPGRTAWASAPAADDG